MHIALPLRIAISILALATCALPLAAQNHTTHVHPSPSVDSATTILLNRELDSVRAAIAKYSDIEVAKRDGFVKFGRDEGALMGEHWFRNDLVHQPLDLTRPSTLQYATINGTKTVVGVAYTVYRKPSDPLPEGFAGNDDHWHVHDVVKLQSAITEGRPLLSFIVRNRNARKNPAIAAGRTELTMIHVWTGINNPDGAFADKHRVLPYLRAGLPAAYADGASENAAWGVALIQSDACESELRSTHGIAQLTRQQRKRLDTACYVSAGKVVKSFRQRDSAAQLNAVAADAWGAYLTERDKTLTAEQKQRMATVVEHPMGG